MNEFKERFAEMAITEWTGARVRVNIELPRMRNSMTSQIVIDDRDLNLLRNLNQPADLEMLDGDSKHMAVIEWQHKRKDARSLVDMIASKIALDLCHAIGSET